MSAPAMENLHLIVGLGNPGAKYARTRHNVGFRLVEELGNRWQAIWKTGKKVFAHTARVERNGKPVMLAQPQTFMDASGESVGARMAYYRLKPARVVWAGEFADLR